MGNVWRYEVSTGRLYFPSGTLCGVGYAGRKGEHRNNPASEGIRNTGPLPRGKYTLRPPVPHWSGVGPKPRHKKMGAWPCIPLEPFAENEMYGRSAFYVHGDNPENDASEGCIILGPQPRAILANAAGDILEVAG